MRPLTLCLLVVGCGPRWGAVRPFAPPAADRTLVAPVSLAVLGNVDPPAPGLLADLAAMEVDVVVVAGDLVQRSAPSTWVTAAQRFEGLPVVAAFGEGERSGDPTLRGARAAWPEGLWSHLTVDTDAGPVRWVFLDPRSPLDQRFWLPGVLADPLAGAVVVMGRPNPELERSARDAAAPEDLCAVVRGGGGVNAWSLPEGAWGAATVEAGASGGPAEELAQDVVTPVFAESLARAFAAEVPAVAARHRRGEPFRPPAFATTGWWHVTIGRDARVTWSLRRRDAHGVWGEVFASTWSPAAGHQAPVVTE